MAKITRIETARLWLRPLRHEDVDALHELWIDPDVRKYLWDDQIIPKEQARSVVEESIALFDAKGLGLWAVLLRGEEALSGFCGYWFFRDPPELELLYGMTPVHWGKGLAMEAARAILRYGFEELGFERVVGSTDIPNVASIRVMEKAGMTFAKRACINTLDTVFYAIARDAFLPDKAPYTVQRR